MKIHRQAMTFARGLTTRLTVVVIGTSMALAVAAQSLRDRNPPKEPLALEQQGSLSVGGRQFHTDAASGDRTFIHLPAIGLRGNRHTFMQDRSNLQVADNIDRWIDQHKESALATAAVRRARAERDAEEPAIPLDQLLL